MTNVTRALISVSDKTGVVDLGRRLAKLGVEILSTGGTSRSLREAGLTVRDVSDFTGFPEMLDGRVKTLHPRVHGGILGRPTPEHEKQMKEHKIDRIDLVVVNLYPFRETVARGAAFDVQAVCSGFIYGLSVADNFIRGGQARTILLIGAESMSRVSE